MPWTELRLQQTGKNSKNIPCWCEIHAWRWGRSPIPLPTAAIRIQALFLCLSVFLHSPMSSSISQPRALQPQSAQPRIQIFWASAIWTKAPVLPGILHRLEWKKNKNIPWSWVKAARLPWALSRRQGAAPAPLQPPAETEPAGETIN